MKFKVIYNAQVEHYITSNVEGLLDIVEKVREEIGNINGSNKDIEIIPPISEVDYVIDKV